MFKIALLLAVAAMAAAEPGLWAPWGVKTVVPAITSTSAYSTSIVHPPSYHGGHGLWHNSPWLVGSVNTWPVYGSGVHHLRKRSLGALVAPAVSYSYSSPWYGSNYGYGWGWGWGYPRALSVHPY